MARCRHEEDRTNRSLGRWYSRFTGTAAIAARRSTPSAPPSITARRPAASPPCGRGGSPSASAPLITPRPKGPYVMTFSPGYATSLRPKGRGHGCLDPGTELLIRGDPGVLCRHPMPPHHLGDILARTFGISLRLFERRRETDDHGRDEVPYDTEGNLRRGFCSRMKSIISSRTASNRGPPPL